MARYLPEWNRLGRISAALNLVALPGGASYSVTLRDPASELPLNEASKAELTRLLTALSVSADRVLVVSQSIIDWRDPNALHGPDGAEWGDNYRNLTPPIRPANGPFTSIRELRLVRGIDPHLFARLDSLARIFPEGPVNVNAAPGPVLRALPGLDEEAVGALLGGRSVGDRIRSLLDLESRASATSRGSIERSFARLAPSVSFEPTDSTTRPSVLESPTQANSRQERHGTNWQLCSAGAAPVERRVTCSCGVQDLKVGSQRHVGAEDAGLPASRDRSV